MKTLRFLSFLFIFSLLDTAALANTSMTMPSYFQATCQDYTGTWQGFMTDPSQLFADGGPWPVTVDLYQHEGIIIGQTSKTKVVQRKRLWAQCKDGILSHLFWGDKGQCGDFSKQGLLVSKNVLVLSLHYENAMNGTDFLVFLQRKNNTYSHVKPRNSELALGKVKSCH
jgi:hypothetical protein